MKKSITEKLSYELLELESFCFFIFKSRPCKKKQKENPMRSVHQCTHV